MRSAAGAALGAGVLAVLVGLLWRQADLLVPAKTALIVFLVCAMLWIFTRLDAAWVALAAVVVLTALGATSKQMVFEMLGLDIIWLMIGAFAMGAAIERTGLAVRLAEIVARRARDTTQLFWFTTALMVPFTFLIPSTSGRAATMLSLMQIIPEAQRTPIRRAYSLLIPVVILLATSAALTGAGSHLVIEELLLQRLGDRFGFGYWALWGVPFAIVSVALACWAILRLFLNAEQRRMPLAKPAGGEATPLSPPELRTIGIVSVTLLLWFTAGWHGFGIAIVAIVAMLALTAPRLGVMSFKQAAKAVNWSLVLFVGAAMLLGRTLIDTQAAPWVTAAAFEALGMGASNPQALPEWAIVAGMSAITMASHLVITSHVARAAALGPPLLLFAQTAGVDPIAVLFIGAIGINYCITLPVCSKALMVFQDAESGGGFRTADLVRLSAVLALPSFALMIATYFLWWKWTGLSLV
jgi:anion transporter